MTIGSILLAAALAAFPEWSAPRAVTQGPHEHLLASYFGIDSWSPNKRYMLVLETDINGRLPNAGERCTIGVVDLEDNNRFIPVSTTACWNFQEAAMGFWMNDDEILFNDLRDGKFKTVIMNWRTGKDVRVLPMPVSAVSEDRTWAVSINYARLSLLRPDYGYAGPGQDARETVPWPEDDGLWTMDLKTGATKLILSVAATRSQQPEPKRIAGKPGQPLAYHCHTVISKDGAKIFFLARSVDWFDKVAHKIPYWNTTSFTVNRDGTDLRRCFRDGWAGSHFNWAPDGSHKMLVTATWNGANDPKLAGRGWSTVEFEVGRESEVRRIGAGILDADWHCIYSPDGQFMSGETYPMTYNERPWVLVRLADGMTMPMGSFYVPPAYRQTYWRCDLHARFRPDGRQIAFNSVHEGSRQVYVRDIRPAGPSSGAAVRRFPAGGWSGATVVTNARSVAVRGADGKNLLTFYNPNVRVTVAGDHLTIDPRPAYKAGAREVVLNSHDLDLGPLAGKALTVRSRWSGQIGVGVRSYLEGRGLDKRHFYTSRAFGVRREPADYDLVRCVPEDLEKLHFRFDIIRNKADVVDFYGIEYAPVDVLPPYEAPRRTPELLFRATFDGTAKADFARGVAEPKSAKGLTYVPSPHGRAVRMTKGNASELEYALAGNACPERGTVAMWIKTEWPDRGYAPDGRGVWRWLFDFLPGTTSLGSGKVSLWWYSDAIRGDQRDFADRYAAWKIPYADDWRHVAMTWSEAGIQLFVNGQRNLSDSDSALKRALETADPLSFNRGTYTSFAVGGRGATSCEGLIDEIAIYSDPLSPKAIRDLYLAGARKQQPVDWQAVFADRANPFEGRPADRPELEKVAEYRFPGVVPKSVRSNAVGACTKGTCAGTDYLELDGKAGSRLALGLSIDTNAPLYVIDIDYPDDRVRTADVIVQGAKDASSDYTLQVGYAAGGEYPNTGRILTHRMYYWTRQPEVALVLMTARADAPAALSAVRLYKVKDAKLPPLAVNEPPAAGGWNRMVGIYNEDPAIGYDFATATAAYSPADLSKTIDACAAYMKFTGQNVLCYPGAWYQGLIEHDRYNPRLHPRDVRKAWYAKFDREGLFYMPTLNPNDMPLDEEFITRRNYYDGGLHDTSVSIHATGLANPGGWHGTPPNFNIAHPDVQRYLEGVIDTLIAEGRDHPSFKGIVLHCTCHNMLTFGTPDAGFNDYCIAAFEREKKVLVAGGGEGGGRGDPLRAKKYCETIMGDGALREKWISWRCETVAKFWLRMARKLAAARPDLKLMINASAASAEKAGVRIDPDDPHFMDGLYRAASMDPALYANEPNVIFCRTLIPADGRWGNFRLPPAKRDFEERRLALAGNYSLWDRASFPWLNHHDRYWESAIGLGQKHWSSGETGATLTCDWMTEVPWRVSTINPSGDSALREIVRPLRFSDVLGFTKGGFLIGTYGMEEPLRRFAAAFRALPAVRFETQPVDDQFPFVRVRSQTFRGRKYLYIVNTDVRPVNFAYSLPSNARDLVTGKIATGKTVPLAPYELKSYACE